MILAVVNLVIIGLAVIGPPLFAIAPWALFRPASPWPLAAAGAVFAGLLAWGGLLPAAALSSFWVLVAGAWWVLSRSRPPTWEQHAVRDIRKRGKVPGRLRRVLAQRRLRRELAAAASWGEVQYALDRDPYPGDKKVA